MFTKYAVVQKINLNGKVLVYFAERDHLNWTFEYRRKPTREENADIFPFVIKNAPNIDERQPGAETHCFRGQDEIIHFSDDYGVPEGFVICILGPEGYVPTLIKFREKTAIPIYQNGYANGSPGYVQLKSNKTTRQAALILMTTSSCLFGASVEFSPCLTEFPSNINVSAADTFEASIMLHSDNAEYLTQSDIQQYCLNVPSDYQVELLDSLNELIDIMKYSSSDSNNILTIKGKISSIVCNLVGLGSGVVTIADSVSNHGFAYSFLRMIFSYFEKSI